VLMTEMQRHLDVLELGQKIQTQVKANIDKGQREYFLHEQMKAIQKELGQGDERQTEVTELREKINTVGMPDVVKKEALRELDRMAKVPQASPEYSVIRTYMDVMTELPWNKSTEDKLDVNRAAKILDRDHYDLEKVKRRILEFLAVRKLAPHSRGPILCFVGPPGVGKTSLGQSIARAMGRKFIRMSLGGLHDEAELRGHRRTYIGAMPGRIVQELRKAGTNNPVFMLDELDKVGADFRGGTEGVVKHKRGKIVSRSRFIDILQDFFREYRAALCGGGVVLVPRSICVFIRNGYVDYFAGGCAVDGADVDFHVSGVQRLYMDYGLSVSVGSAELRRCNLGSRRIDRKVARAVHVNPYCIGKALVQLESLLSGAVELALGAVGAVRAVCAGRAVGYAAVPDAVIVACGGFTVDRGRSVVNCGRGEAAP